MPDAAFHGARELLFEQRVEHDRGAAGVFQAPDGLELMAKRRRTRDERVRQPEPKVGGRSLHLLPPCPLLRVPHVDRPNALGRGFDRIALRLDQIAHRRRQHD